jgi:hypothetical protein
MFKLRAAIATGGPNLNDSAYWRLGGDLSFAAFTNTSTATIKPITIIDLLTSSTASGGGGSTTGGLGVGVGRLQGGQIAFMAAGTSGGVGALSSSTLGIAVYRNFCTLATQITAAGGPLTSLSVTAVNTVLPSGQTFTLTTAAGGTPQVWTTSAAVAVGATSIPVNSATPSATYAVGTECVGQVGSNLAFGWLNSGSGLPAFPQNGAISLPAITANTLLNTAADPYGPYLTLYPSDVMALYAVSSGSDSIPAGILTPIGV